MTVAGVSDAAVLRTPLYETHLAHGGRMVPFAGYDLPIQYEAGVLQEHLHTRRAAGLFDVSHMGQIELRPRSGDVADAAAALERLVPADIVALAGNRQRYSVFTNEEGGILDDLMIANLGDRLYLVVNAACKAADLNHLRAHLAYSCEIVARFDRGLMALQGPLAAAALAPHAPEAPGMAFMECREMTVAGIPCTVSRSGYTGEDGYEIGMAAEHADAIASALLTSPDVALIGLGARDSLRLEAGLCLYGADLDTGTTPVEAALEWSIQKSRRPGGSRTGGYPGAERIAQELADGPRRRRIGLRPEGKAPVRGGAMLHASAEDGPQIGIVTSGGFGPTAAAPVGMGYVDVVNMPADELVYAERRGARLPVRIAPMPFVEKSYKR